MSARPSMVLTGIGVLSPAGRTKSDFFRCVRQPLPPGDDSDRLAGPPPGALLKYLDVTDPKLKIARYLDPVSKNAIVALGAALADADLEESDIAQDPHAYGIVLGTSRGAGETRKALYESLASKQGKSVSATIFSHCGYNIAAAMAAIAFGIKGPNLTVAGRGDLGLSLLRTASQLMRSRRTHTIFAGFTECNDAAQPRHGTFGELAYLLCLERKDRAVERGAVMLCDVDLHEADGELLSDQNGIAFGLPSHGARLDGDAEPLPLPLSGLKAVGDRYASLIKLGLLSQDYSARERFPEVAFTASVGKIRMEVRIHFAEEGVFAS